MKKLTIITLAVLLSSALLLSQAAYAGCGGCRPGRPDKGGVINKKCPVMGGDIDKENPITTEYKGKKIGFCCPACVEEFNKDPEKYMAKIKDGKKCVIKCPECGAAIDVKKQCKKQGACPMSKGSCGLKAE